MNRLHERTWTFEAARPPGSGPWNDEPDKAQWVDEATDLDCLILRNRLGALCGYVGLPPGHPHHGKDYDDVDVEVHGGLTYADRCQDEKVHGGLTYADRCQDEKVGHGPDGWRVCHTPEPGRPDDVWWLGFDCNHVWDLAPGMRDVYERAGIPGRLGLSEVYRDFAYVQAEVTSLARQLAGVPS